MSNFLFLVQKRYRTGNSDRAFTLIELMITLVIVVILMTVSIVSMSGYLPKQRLLATHHYLESILQRAQNEAYTRSSRVGVTFTNAGSNVLAELYIDSGTTPFVKDAADGVLTSVAFRSDVLFTVTNCAGIIVTIPGGLNATCVGIGCNVIFDASGQAVTPVAIGGQPAGTPADYELFIYSNKLENGTNTREVEALSSGMVKAVKYGTAGNAAGAHCTHGCVNACTE